MNIFDIENWISILRADTLSTNILDEYSKGKMLELWRLISTFKQDGNSSRRCFWIKTDDYTLEDFIEYEEYEGMPDEEVKNRYEQYKEWRGPWIKVTCASYSQTEESDLFFCVFLDSDYVLAINDPNSKGYPIHAGELIDWLIEKINEIKNSLEIGNYEVMIEEVPYRQRKGIIKRKVLWDILPADRNDYRKLFKDSEIDFFLNGDFRVKKYFGKVTARRFYEACAVVYRALGFDDKKYNPGFFKETKEERCLYNGVTPREMYYTYADGRDDGLKNVPLDDEGSFKEWLQSKGPYYEFNGHHPWEIIPSLSISNSLHLFVDKDLNNDKYYLLISGSTQFRSAQTIKGFLSLLEAGYPVVIDDLDILRSRLSETDYIGIVEDSFFYFGESTIAGKNVRDYISLDDYYENKNVYNSIIKNAKWEPLKVAEIKC